ncbi:VWA domain-containing protein [Pyxidicoccus fallax]|uniref:VWA domain-containing protein n=1 Tax=Pyxidicoccus fallax TaxID=394095 RepID=A0A848LTN3_9BACT|nr:VWA domain-containing protein [Pyxidicoccus fallax]NMO21029.1 VWA domain-containing protein [Pyxidicoccus fallax]NPC85292.1 VWA domain-containing protein [Pyxidicoccus fallax]
MKLRTCAHLLLLSTLCGAACRSPVDEPGSTLPGKCEGESPVVAPQKTDILFVIDNSSSMEDEQEGIAQELPAFVEALKTGSGVVQDFRVGVITTSVYLRSFVQGREQFREYADQGGRLQPVPDAAGQATDERFIEGSDQFLVEKFRRLVEQGIDGSGQETPFEAVRLAVTEPLATTAISEGGNAGFLRDGARLLVVVVTDEEDCSSMERPAPVTLTDDTSVDLCSEQADRLTSVDEYFSIFQGLHDSTGASREVLWATIGPVALTDKRAGPVQDVTPDRTYVRNVDCPTSYGPGIRQRAMTEKFDESFNNLDSICKSGYRDTLLNIAALATVAQSIEVVNLPDPRLATVEVTRAGGEVERCSVAAGDLRYEPSGEGRSARLYFLGSCLRRADDEKVEVKVLCAG